MHVTIIQLLTIALPAAAHFSLNYPPSRGDNDKTQATGPCGGLDTPSQERTRWPITGGQLSFNAGHGEAKTAVYLALGNNPATKDFSITLVEKFNQIGLGEFCWNKLAITPGTSEGITAGTNATIQVVQEGHTGGGLYNCADITFVDDIIRVKGCSNSSSVSAEAINNDGAHSGASSGKILKSAGISIVSSLVGLFALSL